MSWARCWTLYNCCVILFLPAKAHIERKIEPNERYYTTPLAQHPLGNCAVARPSISGAENLFRAPSPEFPIVYWRSIGFFGRHMDADHCARMVGVPAQPF